MKFFSFIFLLNLIILTQAERDLPSYFPRCYRDDPNLSNCLLEATEKVRPYIKKGVPELNFPSFDPFLIPEVTLQQGTDAVNYKTSLKNLKLYDVASYKFKRYDFDVKNLKFFVSIDIPRVYIEGDYKMNGKLLTVPIEGKGLCSFNITNSNFTFSQDVQIITKKGINYLEPIKTDINIHIGEVVPKIEGLFEGNEQLAKAINDVIQDNLTELTKEVEPVIEEVLIKIMEETLLKSIYKVPYNKLFPLHEKE